MRCRRTQRLSGTGTSTARHRRSGTMWLISAFCGRAGRSSLPIGRSRSARTTRRFRRFGISSMVAYARLRPAPRDTAHEICAVGVPMSAVPEQNRLCRLRRSLRSGDMLPPVRVASLLAVMRMGGMSSAGWLSNIVINREDLRALRANGVWSCLPLILTRHYLQGATRYLCSAKRRCIVYVVMFCASRDHKSWQGVASLRDATRKGVEQLTRKSFPIRFSRALPIFFDSVR